MWTNRTYNPDVLTCLANLSSDEVFTPPSLVNQILDNFPEDLWSNREAKFLDPATKSGVFLREIVKRLDLGLASQIPHRHERIEHILQHQVYGIAITEMTALLSRRSVYCSKAADGKYSVVSKFDDSDGNIRFRTTNHSWIDARCVYCGASREELGTGRRDDLETHAYEFIHSLAPEKIFNMKFDVIVGNPPYQLNDGGFGRSASPIYQKFVHQAKRLNPRFLTMIIPARWFGGGKGLTDFRGEMLNDRRIRKLVDFEKASDVFPEVDIAGGICYFLWERNYSGPCEVVNVHNGNEVTSIRSLNEFNTFIRHSEAVPIIRKVVSHSEETMNRQVTSRKPFGLPTTARPTKTGDIILRWQNGEGPYKRSEITTGASMIDQWKVVTSYVGYDHAGNPGKDGTRRVFSRIDVLPPGTICTETYLVIGSYGVEQEARNLMAYMKTKFFRFLVAQFMYSHHLTKETYALVPILDMTVQWTDEMLYDRYELTSEERAFVYSKIKGME